MKRVVRCLKATFRPSGPFSGPSLLLPCLGRRLERPCRSSRHRNPHRLSASLVYVSLGPRWITKSAIGFVNTCIAVEAESRQFQLGWAFFLDKYVSVPVCLSEPEASMVSLCLLSVSRCLRSSLATFPHSLISIQGPPKAKQPSLMACISFV